MFDTIVLTIPHGKFIVTQPDKFSPSFKVLQESRGGFLPCKNNPTAEDKRSGTYKPRLTAYKRGYKIELRIEFSAPKIIYGDNLNELEESNFENLIKTLQFRLSEMGVKIFTHDLEQAGISVIHISKNIILSSGYTAQFAIQELRKADVNKKLDMEKVHFRNDGQALQIYSNIHSFVLYDKINDLNKPAKRAIDKDQTKKQLDLFEFIKTQNKNLEILRLEIRLNKKRKINEVLKSIQQDENLCFKDIFKVEISKAILKLYWEQFFGSKHFIFDVNQNPQKILNKILIAHAPIKIKQAVYLVGLNLLCRDQEGIRSLRSIIDNAGKPKTNWDALKKNLDGFNNSLFTNSTYGFIKDIEKSLTEFKPYKVDKI